MPRTYRRLCIFTIRRETAEMAVDRQLYLGILRANTVESMLVIEVRFR